MSRRVTDLALGNTRDWRWKFLEVLAVTASVSEACVAVRKSRQLAYRHRARFPRFRAKWDEAIEISTELLEVFIRRRAFDRSDPYSAQLAMFILKGKKPWMYRDNAPPAVGSDDLDLSSLTDDQLAAIASGQGGGRA